MLIWLYKFYFCVFWALKTFRKYSNFLLNRSVHFPSSECHMCCAFTEISWLRLKYVHIPVQVINQMYSRFMSKEKPFWQANTSWQHRLPYAFLFSLRKGLLRWIYIVLQKLFRNVKRLISFLHGKKKITSILNISILNCIFNFFVINSNKLQEK